MQGTTGALSGVSRLKYFIPWLSSGAPEKVYLYEITPAHSCNEMNKICFYDTHVYPGCLARFYFRVTPGGPFVSASAEFSDGAVAGAEVEPVSAEEVIVRMEAYTTARNTRIPGKTWRLRYDKALEVWKVAKM